MHKARTLAGEMPAERVSNSTHLTCPSNHELRSLALSVDAGIDKLTPRPWTPRLSALVDEALDWLQRAAVECEADPRFFPQGGPQP